MPGTFMERTAYLAEQVGFGDLEGHGEVNQVYSHYQHEGVAKSGRPLVYHHGGGAFFLTNTVIGEQGRWMETLAARAITEDGSELVAAMTDVVEGWSDGVRQRAPVEFDNLRNSTHPWVVDDGATVYDRPPDVPRLSEGALEAERRAAGHEGRERRRRRLGGDL
jgi:hypothetical protein